MIFYTNHLIPKGAAACARGPFIFVRPEYRGDVGLLAHEKVHVWQAWRGLFIAHALLYMVQASHYGDDRLPKFAKFIAERYSLRVREDAALSLLRED